MKAASGPDKPFLTDMLSCESGTALCCIVTDHSYNCTDCMGTDHTYKIHSQWNLGLGFEVVCI